MTEAKHTDLLRKIIKVMRQHGLKRTTMDTVAAELSISKRTLYEIFESKTDMMSQALRIIHEDFITYAKACFETLPNVLLALHDFLTKQALLLEITNVDFFKDMDSKFIDVKEIYNHNHGEQKEQLIGVMKKGVEQGVILPNINFDIAYEMLYVQFEALKRQEVLFSKTFTLAEICSTISTMFLRSIATSKGIEMLDTYQPSEHLQKLAKTLFSI